MQHGSQYNMRLTQIAAKDANEAYRITHQPLRSQGAHRFG